MLVLYATETGNSLDAAERFVRQARSYHVETRLQSVAEYPLEDLPFESIVVFFISTTGSGVHPRPMNKLMSALLRSDLTSDLLDELHFAVFGLGDSAYEKFNWAAKKLDRRLGSLGGIRLTGRGEGDEQDPLGIEGALDPWMDKLFEELELDVSEASAKIDRNMLLSPRASFIPISGLATCPSSRPEGFLATLTRNERLTAESWYQDVRHLEFDFSDPIKYVPGDIAVVYPQVDSGRVNAMLDRLGWVECADDVMEVHLDELRKLPERVTLRQLLTSHLDINAIPRRSFFEWIRHFSDDETERGKLEEFCSSEGQTDLYEYCHKVRRTIREVLDDFKSVTVPTRYVFDVFPPLRPRQFSIASSLRTHPSQIHICMAVVNYKTKLREPRRGTCTSYLSSLVVGSKIWLDIEPGMMKLPEDLSTPIICIGPGTGVAPMKAAIEERVTLDNTLYFGCRSAGHDEHYKALWEKLNDTQSLRYQRCYSRSPRTENAPKYVQDLLRQDGSLVWDALKHGAWIFISGSSNKMPKAVKESLARIVQKYGAQTEEESEEYVRKLEIDHRLFEECWS
ncbi:riboflavin synthase domain-like protein [Sistotremastrum suecicum HHB10207 ss-3]|uniref:NADPH-dependent diflavin oxidoreductase 1 n=1 Tax=Sistotremastrum suecicum HHB10207 ss-3 TaxID=1314776 RepID=A0A166BD86_9AGAM|nr:riboflavin synthase domain-like protein [Sistotremastrum suecicum HHB10207 ss-3]